jgi:putative ABC transport system permease protein
VSALDRKLARDLVRLRGQALTIALVVAAGVASYVTLRSTWASLTASRDAYYDRHRFADVFAHLERAPRSVAAEIEAVPGVASVYPRVVESVLLPVEGMLEPATATLVSIPLGREPPLNGLYLRAGRLPEPGRLDEALVIDSFAAAHGLVPGDRLPAVINGARRELQIAGIALSPEFVFPVSPGDFAPDDKRVAILWMDVDVLGPAFQMDGAFNDVVLALQPGVTPGPVVAELDRILEPYGGLGAVARAKQASNFMLEGELSQLEQFATAFPLIFLAVAAFLLNVVLSRLVALQREQIAVLKAVGYRNRRIALHYLELVLAISLVGAALGVAVGAWLGGAMTDLYARYFRFPALVYRLDPSVAAVGVLVTVASAVAGALGAARSIAKLPPAEAMRPPAPARFRVSRLERGRLGRLLGPSATMVVRELRRRPLRLALSALGIAAGVGVLVVGRFGYDSFDYLIHGVFHEEQAGDMTVALIRPMPERAVGELAHLPGVLAAEGNRAVPVRLRAGHVHRESAILGLADPPRLRRLVDRHARPVGLPGGDGLAISRKLGELLGLGVGDVVTVEVREGNRPVRRLPVAALVDDAFGLQAYMSSAALHRLLGQERSVSLVHLRVDPTRLDDIHRRLEQMPAVAQVTRKQTLIDRFNAQTGETMLAMTLIMTAFAAVIAIGVVYNNARVALSMRSRDLASLRVLGFTRREISAVLLGELAVQVVLAIPLGLVLGTWWAGAIMSSVDPEVYRLPIVVSTQSYAFAVLVAGGAGLISALLVRRKLDHLDLIAVLKTRE